MIVWFARTVLTRYHKSSGFSNRYLVSQGPGWEKFRIKVSAGWISPETGLLASKMATSWLCPPWFFFCVQVAQVSLCVTKSPLLIRTHSNWIRAHSDSLPLKGGDTIQPMTMTIDIHCVFLCVYAVSMCHGFSLRELLCSKAQDHVSDSGQLWKLSLFFLLAPGSWSLFLPI